MENLTIYNDNISLLELLNKYDSGKIVVNCNCRNYDSFGDVDNILTGLYNPVIWLLEDRNAIKTILYRSRFVDFLSRFYKDKVTDDYGIKFSEYKSRQQNKFEDAYFNIKTISYHPELDIDKVLRTLDYNH
jgi:hypothetical protein